MVVDAALDIVDAAGDAVLVAGSWMDAAFVAVVLFMLKILVVRVPRLGPLMDGLESRFDAWRGNIPDRLFAACAQVDVPDARGVRSDRSPFCEDSDADQVTDPGHACWVDQPSIALRLSASERHFPITVRMLGRTRLRAVVPGLRADISDNNPCARRGGKPAHWRERLAQRSTGETILPVRTAIAVKHPACATNHRTGGTHHRPIATAGPKRGCAYHARRCTCDARASSCVVGACDCVVRRMTCAPITRCMRQVITLATQAGALVSQEDALTRQDGALTRQEHPQTRRQHRCTQKSGASARMRVQPRRKRYLLRGMRMRMRRKRSHVREERVCIPRKSIVKWDAWRRGFGHRTRQPGERTHVHSKRMRTPGNTRCTPDRRTTVRSDTSVLLGCQATPRATGLDRRTPCPVIRARRTVPRCKRHVAPRRNNRRQQPRPRRRRRHSDNRTRQQGARKLRALRGSGIVGTVGGHGDQASDWVMTPLSGRMRHHVSLPEQTFHLF